MSEISIIKDYLKDKRVIYIDDDVDLKSCIEELFISFSSHIQFFTSAKSFLDNYTLDKYDLIITDIEMPNKSGISLVEDIRKKDIDTLVIMVTAYSNEEYLLELINLNINQYILKPVNSDSLLNGIIKAFGKRLKEIIPFHKDLYFDMEQRELFYKEQLIPLRKRDKEFLLLLHRNRNVVVTYDLIEEYLWRDKSMSITALKTFIKEFRKRIPIEIITNKPQEGYKLINF